MSGVTDFNEGRGVIQDTDGTVRLDTDGRLFHITDPAINDSKNFAARQAPQSLNDFDFSASHVIGSCNSFATHIVGMFKVHANSGTSGLPYDKYFDASGTYIHVFASRAAGNPTASNIGVAQLVTYTFRCSSGVVYLDENVHLGGVGTGVTLIIPAHTITWKLKAGLFT